MKIVSCNLNGIRSAHRKGFFDWYKKQRSDVLCIQELKAQEDQIDTSSMFSKNTFSYFKCAEKKDIAGYQFTQKLSQTKLYMNMVIMNLTTKEDILKLSLEIYL
jgi:exodeoxyribonuclease-3